MPMSHYYKFGLYVRTMVQLTQLILLVWQASIRCAHMWEPYYFIWNRYSVLYIPVPRQIADGKSPNWLRQYHMPELWTYPSPNQKI